MCSAHTHKKKKKYKSTEFRKIRHSLPLSDLKKTNKKLLNLKILASVTHAGSFITSWRDTRQSWTDLMKSKGKENSRQAWTGPKGSKSQSWACHHSRIISAHWSLPSFVLAGNLLLNEFNNSIMIVWCLPLPLRVWTLKGGKKWL